MQITSEGKNYYNRHNLVLIGCCLKCKPGIFIPGFSFSHYLPLCPKTLVFTTKISQMLKFWFRLVEIKKGCILALSKQGASLGKKRASKKMATYSKLHKHPKPANYDNSWLGVTVTTAYCYNKAGKLIFTTIDAPNPVAWAVQNNPQITKVSGLLGEYDIKEMKKRFLGGVDFKKDLKSIKSI